MRMRLATSLLFRGALWLIAVEGFVLLDRRTKSSPAIPAWVTANRPLLKIYGVENFVELPSPSNQVVLQKSEQERASTEKKKVKKIPKVYKHLFRHYDDVSFDSWLRCEGPINFLLSVGYTDTEINHLAEAYPPILELNVHGQLAPKIRFLVDTLGGGSGTLTWVEEAQDDMKFDEECNIHNADKVPVHTMRVSESAKKIIPPSFFKCNLDRSLGPRHAFLVHAGLPSGPALLKDDGRLLKELLDASSLNDFVELCNRWVAAPLHTAEGVDAFERIFCAGLIPAARGDMTDALTDIGCSAGTMIELLVAHGANHLKKDPHGVLPLYWAAGTGNVQGVEALVKAHLADMPQEIQGNDKVDNFLDLMLHTPGAKNGATPLHWASCGISLQGIGRGGSYDVCRLLLQMAGERRSELANALTFSQTAPLMWASLTDNLSVIELLVLNGADPHAVNGQGANVAHWAVSAGHLEVCQYLYDSHSVDFLLKDNYGKTPLDYALDYDRKDVVDWLVQTFYSGRFESGSRRDKHASSLTV